MHACSLLEIVLSFIGTINEMHYSIFIFNFAHTGTYCLQFSFSCARLHQSITPQVPVNSSENVYLVARAEKKKFMTIFVRRFLMQSIDKTQTLRFPELAVNGQNLQPRSIGRVPGHRGSPGGIGPVENKDKRKCSTYGNSSHSLPGKLILGDNGDRCFFSSS